MDELKARNRGPKLLYRPTKDEGERALEVV